jgi:hypothetical protein
MTDYDLTSELDTIADLRVLIWGPPGVGKTWLASTFPDPVFVDTDVQGIRCVSHPRYRRQYGDRDIRYRTFTDKVDENGLFVKATGFQEAVQFVNEVARDDSVGTIVMDSLTTFQVLAMNLGLELSQFHKRSKSLAKAQAPGAEMRAFEQFMNGFVTIKGKHLVCLAHERTETNNEGQIIWRGPYLIGTGIRGLIGSWFHEVWALKSMHGGRRELLTEPDNVNTVLKSRGGVPDGLEAPEDFDSLAPDYNTIKEALLEAGNFEE